MVTSPPSLMHWEIAVAVRVLHSYKDHATACIPAYFDTGIMAAVAVLHSYLNPETAHIPAHLNVKIIVAVTEPHSSLHVTRADITTTFLTHRLCSQCYNVPYTWLRLISLPPLRQKSLSVTVPQLPTRRNAFGLKIRDPIITENQGRYFKMPRWSYFQHRIRQSSVTTSGTGRR